MDSFMNFGINPAGSNNLKKSFVEKQKVIEVKKIRHRIK
jgi:hypothetical protein